MISRIGTRRVVRLVALALGAAIVVALIGALAEPRWQHVFIMFCLWSIMGMGWLLLWRVGEISLGQVAFLGIGGYSSVILSLKLGFPVWPSLLVGGLVSAAVAAVIGLILMRLRGIFFLVVSFAFAEIVRVSFGLSRWLGGSEGMWGIPVPKDIGPVTFTTKEGWVYLFFVLLVMTALVCWRIERSRIGRIYTAVGTSPPLAQSLGLNVMKYRVQALVIGALTTGLAGAMHAHYIGVASAYSYEFWGSLVAQIVPLMGGVAFLVGGPLTGSLVFALVDNWLASVPGIRMAIYGVTVMTIIFFLPEGILSLPKRLRVRRSQTVGIARGAGPI